MSGDSDKAEQTAKEALEVAERCGAKFFNGWNQKRAFDMLLLWNISRRYLGRNELGWYGENNGKDS